MMMRTFWNWICSPCWFGHDHRVIELTPGRYGGTRFVLVCPRCRDEHDVNMVAMDVSL